MGERGERLILCHVQSPLVRLSVSMRYDGELRRWHEVRNTRAHIVLRYLETRNPQSTLLWYINGRIFYL